MEQHGVFVEREALEEISREAETEIRALETRIFEAAGGPFNPNSPQQLAEVLFDRLKLPRRGAAAENHARLRPMFSKNLP